MAAPLVFSPSVFSVTVVGATVQTQLINTGPDGFLSTDVFNVTTAPTKGAVAYDPTTGIVTYTPAANASGTDQLVFDVSRA
jgi:hypothetical protein